MPQATKRPDPKKIRVAAGMSRVQLAVMASIGIQTIVRCERDRRWPIRPTVKQRYMAALGLSQ